MKEGTNITEEQLLTLVHPNLPLLDADNYRQVLIVGERAHKDDDLSKQAGHSIYTIETQTGNRDRSGNARLGLTRQDIQTVIFHARSHHVQDERDGSHQSANGLKNLVVSTEVIPSWCLVRKQTEGSI